MGSLGGHLRELRTARGVSLDDIARATRVTKGYLEALEEERTADLPAPVFARGFIRSYCQFLQVPADEALEEYSHLVAAAAAAPPRAAPARGRGPARPGGPLLMSVILLVVLGVALVGVTLWLRGEPGKRGAGPVAPAPVASSRPADSAPLPTAGDAPPASAGTAASLPAPPAAPAARAEPGQPGHRLLIRAVELTWVRVQPDGGPPVEELLQAGTVREWTASTRFVLTVGNAAGIEIELDGQRLATLGGRGAVVRELVLPAETSPRS